MRSSGSTPTDLVVPEGGRLRLTVTGSVQAFDGLDGLAEGAGAFLQGPSAPSGSQHDRHRSCTPARRRASLRFTVPGRRSSLLDVREADQAPESVGASPRAPSPPVDGGGLATPLGAPC